MDVAALALSVLAVLIALVPLAQARRASRQATASQSTDVPESPDGGDAAPARRDGSPRATQASPPGRPGKVSFELTLVAESTYVLRNRGSSTAYDVKLKAHRLGKNRSFSEFPSRHSEECELEPTGDPDRNVVEITWHLQADGSDPVQHKRLRLTTAAEEPPPG